MIGCLLDNEGYRLSLAIKKMVLALDAHYLQPWKTPEDVFTWFIVSHATTYVYNAS